MKRGLLQFCAAVGIVILMVFFSACLDDVTDISSPVSGTGSGSSSGSCGDGYARYTTSAGHCCPTGYAHYYDGACHQCSEGYSKYTTSAGHCCPTGYTHYYDGTCHQCSEGYYKYTTSAGHCCPEGYPYYSNGKCYTRQQGTGTAGTGTVQVDTRSGCPANANFQCSQWIETGRCQIQSCTCYFSGTGGDTTAAFYRTANNAYFRCSGAGQTLSCTSAALAIANYCS